MFACMYVPIILTLLQGMALQNHVHFTHLLLSKDWEQRQQAYHFAKKAEWSLRATAMDLLFNVVKRNQSVPRSTQVENDQDAQCSPRTVALAVLAVWNVSEAIPLFIEHIHHPSHVLGYHLYGMRDFPNLVTDGLIRLGKPAAKPIILELATMNPGLDGRARRGFEFRRAPLVYCLEKIMGYRAAYDLVEAEAKRLQFRDQVGFYNMIEVLDMISRHGNLDLPLYPWYHPKAKK